MSEPWFQFYDQGVPRSVDFPSTSLYPLLEKTARDFPDRKATLFFGQGLNYRDLLQQARVFARALQDLGIKKGDRLGILLPNCPQFVIGYYGAMRVGAIVVPMNPLYVERELEFMLKDSGVTTVLTLDLFVPRLKNIQARTPLKNIIVTHIKDYLPTLLKLLYPIKEWKEKSKVTVQRQPGTFFLAELLAKSQGEPEPVQINPLEDVAILQYTGGTTGLPKGAMLTHWNLVHNAVSAKYWLLGAGEGYEIVMGVLPFFHVFGMTVVMNLAVLAGATMVLHPRFVLKDVLKSVDRHRPTIFPGAPAMFAAINNFAESKKYNLSSIKACISGSAPLPLEVQQTFERITGGKLVEGYGLTEASPVTHCNPLYGYRKIGSIGLPFPDTQCRIMDLVDGEQELAVGEVGELAVKGPQVMKGYWNRPDETAKVLRGGWLYTGDIAKLDEEGFFYIVDRKKDMIITGGYNVYPREVEEILYSHPKVLEAAVAGLPDPYRGEMVKAYVVLRTGEQATAEEIIAYCREKLARYKVPREVEFRKELPKTFIGKVLRRTLREEEAQKARTGGKPA
ncbi:MAG: long-chain fatty acid--CoA ligase [Firmicutes bacterium]|nr:long-chain fatty acid--CoA ligase [Bacillota bacterium]MCL5040483.1 long-chain fatty acid--CoA ligase [Bacillota bacterium]